MDAQGRGIGGEQQIQKAMIKMHPLMSTIQTLLILKIRHMMRMILLEFRVQPRGQPRNTPKRYKCKMTLIIQHGYTYP